MRTQLKILSALFVSLGIAAPSYAQSSHEIVLTPGQYKTIVCQRDGGTSTAGSTDVLTGSCTCNNSLMVWRPYVRQADGSMKLDPPKDLQVFASQDNCLEALKKRVFSQCGRDGSNPLTGSCTCNNSLMVWRPYVRQADGSMKLESPKDLQVFASQENCLKALETRLFPQCG